MKILTVVVGPLEENCYIVYDEESKEAIVFDPGAEAEKIIEVVEANDLHPIRIVNTHGHFDHVGAITDLKKNWDVPFYMNRADEGLLDRATRKRYQAKVYDDIILDGELTDGEWLQLGKGAFFVIHTPGHTKGGSVFYFKEAGFAITGDTLFKGTVGRTDLEGGSYTEILHSVQHKLSVLSDDCVIYPGHGPKSTMGFERLHNPYLR